MAEMRAILLGRITHDPLEIEIMRERFLSDGYHYWISRLVRLELPAGAAVPPEGPALVEGEARWEGETMHVRVRRISCAPPARSDAEIAWREVGA